MMRGAAKSARALAWGLFLVWGVWLFSLQAWIASGSALAHWVPDLGLILGLSLLARAEERDLPLLAFFTMLARSAVSAEPVVALLAGFLGVFALALLARSMVELTGPAWRALITGALVLLFDAWLMLVHRVRTPGLATALPLQVVSALPAAVTSGLLAFLCGPLFAHLPGLTPLRRRRW